MQEHPTEQRKPMTYEEDIIGICPGCDIDITIEDAGGYRTYCQKCVDAMPPLPRDGKGYNIKGRYPNFEWVE